MRAQKNRRKGFTYVEAVVVAVIIGMLAAVVVPTMYRSIKRTRAGEAIAGVRAIALQMRVMESETGSYLDIPDAPDGNDFVSGTTYPVINPGYAGGTEYPGVPGLKPGDLTGAFFVDDDYEITVTSPFVGNETFTVVATGNSRGTKPKAQGITVTIDQNENVSVNVQ